MKAETSRIVGVKSSVGVRSGYVLWAGAIQAAARRRSVRRKSFSAVCFFAFLGSTGELVGGEDSAAACPGFVILDHRCHLVRHFLREVIHLGAVRVQVVEFPIPGAL